MERISTSYIEEIMNAILLDLGDDNEMYSHIWDEIKSAS